MKSDLAMIDYGIQNEESDIRAHVCPVVQRVYVYPTACGREAMSCGELKHGYQPGVSFATGKGFCVPPFQIRRCVALVVNPEVWIRAAFDKKESTTIKGEKAVFLVAGMIRNGLFPLPLAGIADADISRDLQIKGDDIRVWVANQCVHIQVKCDFNGGEKHLGGTGNLFLQTAEINLFKRH